MQFGKIFGARAWKQSGQWQGGQLQAGQLQNGQLQEVPEIEEKNRRTLFAGGIFLLLLVAAALLPSNYLVQSAGPVIDVNSKIDARPLVSLENVPTHETKTQLFLTTVSAWGSPEQGVPGAQAFAALFQRNAQLIPVRAFYPAQVEAAQVEARNTELMTNSQDSAALVAFQLAGYPVSMDVKVVAVDAQKPSGKVLQQGDLIRGIGVGKAGAQIVPTKSHYELAQVLNAVAPGSEVTLEIERDGKILQQSFATVAYEADATGWVHPGSLLGVGIMVENVQLPGKVKYLVEGIGGPSAGNMFALGIYDQLTPGDLGGEKKIAGTGSVAWNGDVGAIGGIAHKITGAAAAGVTDFLAPAENCLEVPANPPKGMRVWAVRTTEESIAAVTAISRDETANLVSCADIVAQRVTP